MTETIRRNTPTNHLKAALSEGRRQIGLWLSSASPTVAEIASSSGFDWLLIDMEHSPNDVPQILAQLRAMAGTGVSPVVRPPSNNPVDIKRLLDAGVQSLLLPMVNRPEEAEAAVRAMRYAPIGMRGYAGTTRANLYGRASNYSLECEAELCLIIQAESLEALENIDRLAAVDGVDAVFFGAADLAMEMGLLGNVSHQDLWKKIEPAANAVGRAGKPIGILLTKPDDIGKALAYGFTFVGVGNDIKIIAAATEALADLWRSPQ